MLLRVQFTTKFIYTIRVVHIICSNVFFYFEICRKMSSKILYATNRNVLLKSQNIHTILKT